VDSTWADLLLCVHDSASGDHREWVWASPHGRRLAVVPVTGKGQGATAARSFAAGELLLAERPFVRWWQDVDRDKASNLSALTRTVDGLDATSAHHFFALTQSASTYGSTQSVLGTFLSNAYPTDDDGDLLSSRGALAEAAPSCVSSAVFATFSRFNHACVPNAHHAWQSECNAMVVHALCPIAEGEEVTVTYIGEGAANEPCELRRAYLEHEFDFSCSCALCVEQGGKRGVCADLRP